MIPATASPPPRSVPDLVPKKRSAGASPLTCWPGARSVAWAWHFSSRVPCGPKGCQIRRQHGTSSAAFPPVQKDTRSAPGAACLQPHSLQPAEHQTRWSCVFAIACPLTRPVKALLDAASATEFLVSSLEASLACVDGVGSCSKSHRCVKDFRSTGMLAWRCW